jgi:hypothetical protein
LSSIYILRGENSERFQGFKYVNLAGLSNTVQEMSSIGGLIDFAGGPVSIEMFDPINSWFIWERPSDILEE